VAELPLASPARTGWPWTDGTRPSLLPDGRSWPRITIVTPSFNQGAFVEESIRSVLLQAYPDLELIVVDGGSTDGSVEATRKYSPWIAHWIVEGDTGPADALNKGFRLATGEILGFLNADDFLLPACLAGVAREFTTHSGADVVSGHGFLAKPSSELGPPSFSDRWDLARFAYGACILVQPATFFRGRAFQQVRGFNGKNQTCWDMELWADMALAGAAFRSVDEFWAAFRLHADSISRSPQLRRQRLQDTRAVRQKMTGRPEAAGDRLYSLLYRVRKFSRHPGRTLKQRLMLRSTLNRWL